MLLDYIKAALQRAALEEVSDTGRYYAGIPIVPGVWAEGDTPDECRAELVEVLEESIFLAIRLGHALPEIDGARLRLPAAV